jgi:hypothetical protein
MTVLVADGHAHVQRLISVVEMATVLEGCTTEEQRSIVRFLSAKGLTAKNVHTEMFSVRGGKCLSLKVVHNWTANVSLMTKSLKPMCVNG